MKKASAILLILVALLLFTCSCGTANENLSGSVFTEDGVGKYLSGCYLRVNGIDGDCSDAAHEKWIDVIDFDLGAERDGEGAQDATIEPLVIVHKVDSASPKFQKYCTTGQLISEVKLEKTVAIAGREHVSFAVTLKNASVTSAKITCDANGSIVETAAFTYDSAAIEYTPVKGDGVSGTTAAETIVRRS